jgi:hypothetical protein
MNTYYLISYMRYMFAACILSKTMESAVRLSKVGTVWIYCILHENRRNNHHAGIRTTLNLRIEAFNLCSTSFIFGTDVLTLGSPALQEL